MAQCPTTHVPVGGDLPLRGTKNANDFLLKFRRIQDDYEYVFRDRITDIRNQYAGKPEEDILDQSLEAHIRVYVVNALLNALNWRLDQSPKEGLPNLFPEAPVRSQQSGTIRFLDYLGLERQSDNPLLIVETKRPSAKLPTTKEPAGIYSEIISHGLAGENLSSEWNKWLRDLREYVRSIHTPDQQIPTRVAITNGDWLILFLDPSDAFLEIGRRNPNRILVFKNKDDIEGRSNELFRELEYQQVLRKTPPLRLGELNFHISQEVVDYAMHGLRLHYIEQRSIYQISPILKVAPEVFIHSRYGGWLRVENPPKEYEIPHDVKLLPLHLNQVEQSAKKFLTEVNNHLGLSLQPQPLRKHYEDGEGFAVFPGVAECGSNDYLIITGDKTHYLLPDPSVPNCPYHDWTACNQEGIASNLAPIVGRSISPRSFFMSGENHHCAHNNVSNGKSSQLTMANRSRCGSRSGDDGQAFCEIWSFEQHLCCRTCAFEEVCTKATVFQLPCQR